MVPSSLVSVKSSAYGVSLLNTNDAMALKQVEIVLYREAVSLLSKGAPAKHAHGKLYH